MARPIWKGSISFGLVNIPVQLETAVREKTVSFHMLSKDGSCRVRRKLVCPETGEEINYNDTARGIEVGKDEYVLVDEKELEKLKPEKGVNFPDTDFSIPALTGEDRTALRFVARHADTVEFSFVQSHEDVAELQEALARERPEDWHLLGLVLKIETSRAVRNLPDMLVRAAGRQPSAIMIARGDLAVEIGFVRLAEMQEQILWLCEAAHVPVIWATQVLESYLKTGVPTRGEMTDAAMAARAECVMLNKGPYLFEGIEQLGLLLGRMSGHMSKKTPQLRAFQSW